MKKPHTYGLTVLALTTIGLTAVCQTPGSLDLSFSIDGKRLVAVGLYSDAGSSVAVQPDGNIVVAGTSNDCDMSVSPASIYNYGLLRLLPNGSSDNTFGSLGELKTDFNVSDDRIMDIAVESATGKIIASGQTYDTTGGANVTTFSLARYLSTGALDVSFGTNGKQITLLGYNSYVNSMVLQPDGKIVMSGYATINGNQQLVVVRYTTNGTLDGSFNSSGTVQIPLGANLTTSPRAMVLQPDGKILLGGTVYDNNALLTGDMLLVRLNSDGSLDTGFGNNGIERAVINGFAEDVYEIALQPDGKIVISGTQTSSNMTQDFLVARYTANGALDTSFDTDGIVTGEFIAGSRSRSTTLVIQQDGKIIVGGIVAATSNNTDFALARFLATGAVDNSFGTNGMVTTDMGASAEHLASLTLQPDGKLIAVGWSDKSFAVARYATTASGLGLSEMSGYETAFSIFPNPVADQMTVSYHLSQESAVSMQLVDISGRYVTQLKHVSSELAGDHELSVSLPAEVQTGCYYIVLTEGADQQVARIMVAK